MNNKLAFLLGAVVGAAGTWYFVKKKYEQIAQEEIDSVKEVFSRREEATVVEERNTNKSESVKPDLMDYAKRIEREGYMNEGKKEKRENKGKRPYVIPPEEFGQVEEHELIGLTYYADGILADDGDDPIENVDELVGADFADHFGEFEDDSVYVRNEERKVDYEILRDLRTHEEAIDPRS